MKIEVKLNTTSIQNAIKVLKQQKKQLKQHMFRDFIFACCERIIQFANENVMATTIGDNVKSDILSGWSFKTSYKNGYVIIRNTAEKAVYVEFGTGIVGASNPHENALVAGEGGTPYEYNVPSPSKRAGSFHDENTWRFYKSEQEDVDLLEGDYEVWQTKNGDLKIITRGSPATMFLFNAIVRFVSEDVAKTEWQRIKTKYWG